MNRHTIDFLSTAAVFFSLQHVPHPLSFPSDAQTPKDKLRWWDHKQRILEHWLDTSGDEISVEGASELIRGQLQRGDAHEHLRIKCWKHIVIELSALVEDDTAPSNGRYTAVL